jgi:hypothetical protein
MDFDEEDQSRRKFPKFPKFYEEKAKVAVSNEDETRKEEEKEKTVNIKYVPIPVPINREKRFKDRDVSYNKREDESEDSDDEVEQSIKGNLDKWDKGARIWLSSGTMFFLIILFHLIQVRNDLRNFTTAANNQIESACSVLENKTTGFQKALDMAAQDVGPISFKFVRDLKTKVKSAFHFAAQIFGGKVREVFIAIFQEYYCLVVGALVIYQSLTKEIYNAINQLFDGNVFISTMTELMETLIDNIVRFISDPEKYFSDLFVILLDYIFDKTMVSVIIPSLTGKDMNEICDAIQAIDFSEIDRLIKGYMAKIIAVIAIVLVLYNYFNFIVTLETGKDDTLSESSSKSDTESDFDESFDKVKKIKSYRESKIPLSSLWYCLKWLKNFLKYPPFWIFLCMGTFGVLHIKFSGSLRLKAEELIANYVEPTIEGMRTDFVTMLKNYVFDLEKMWKEAFLKMMKPFKDFIKGLTRSFGGSFHFVLKQGKVILNIINFLVQKLDLVTISDTILKAITAILDCFILRNIRKWVQIVEIIYTRLFGGKWNDLNGGIMDILQKSISAIFGKLQLSSHLKGFFSMHFAMFLNLVAKRSIFLYVYLIFCAILLCQGVLMMLIKLLLGYF